MTNVTSVSVSHLQFHLSKILDRSSQDAAPFVITKRHQCTHLVLPIALITDEILRAMGDKGEGLRSCGKCGFPKTDLSAVDQEGTR